MVQIRQATESDHQRVLPFLSCDPLQWVDAETYRRYLESGSYGVDRIWLAEDDGRIKACAVWYGPPASDHALIVDCLWVDPNIGDRAALGAAVLRAGHQAFQAAAAKLPEYHLFLTPGWRNDPAIFSEVHWRRTAARSTDLTEYLERLRYEWTADARLLPSSGRLMFSTERDDDLFLSLFERVATRTLDHGTHESVARLGLEGHAREMLACCRGMRGERAWWRIARTPEGHVAGFTIPSANEDGPVIGYLGVVPEMRGRGYGLDLLIETTRILVANGAERIRSDTDMTNVPMAKTFERAGYENFGVRLVISAPRQGQPHMTSSA